MSYVSAFAGAPSPEPDQFSEVAPAAVAGPYDLRPRASYYATHGASALWPKFFGAPLATVGLLFVFLALRMRRENGA